LRVGPSPTRKKRKSLVFSVDLVFLDRISQRSKMKTPKFFSTLLVVAFTLAPQLLNTSHKAFAASGGTYSAKLISPRLGQVLYPGQQVRVEWTAVFPDMRNLHGCEMELWLSLDGGRTFTTCITPTITPNTKYYDWTVPNTPTNAAVLDVRFGCELYYPESRSPQPSSTFVIARTAPPVR
jgi:hypothetical protein